jgi:hypothetical protein
MTTMRKMMRNHLKKKKRSQDILELKNITAIHNLSLRDQLPSHDLKKKLMKKLLQPK